MNDRTLRSGFIPELNGLRAIAIILVFLSHVRLFLPVTHTSEWLIHSYLGLGWMGVDLFFVLSGFLITGILLDTRNATNYFSGFYARRVLRIFPLYYLVLTGVIVAQLLLKNSVVSSVLPIPQDRWLYYLYLTNWTGLMKGTWGANYLGHFWSLGVEEQFYFVWPLLVWFLPLRAIPRVAAGLATLAVLVRLAWVAHGGPQIAIALATVTRMDSLFVGAVCAYLFRSPSWMSRISRWLPLAACLGVGSFVTAYSMFLFLPHLSSLVLYGAPSAFSLDDATMLLAAAGGYTLLAVGFGATVLHVSYTEDQSSPLLKLLRTRVLGSIGTYSYGIYVYHVPILGATLVYVAPYFFPHGTPRLIPGIFFIVGLAIVTYVVAAISYELFERKILGLKRHFEPRHPLVPVSETSSPAQSHAATSSHSI